MMNIDITPPPEQQNISNNHTLKIIVSDTEEADVGDIGDIGAGCLSPDVNKTNNYTRRVSWCDELEQVKLKTVINNHRVI